jgi:hypothetical protein
MKRCWLHVGMNKTGSTSVQMNLWKNGNIPGWHYLTPNRRHTPGDALVAMLGKEPTQFHTFMKRGMIQSQVKRVGDRLRSNLTRAIRSSRDQNLILSAEVLSVIDRAGIETLREILTPLCDEIKVIGYVRPPCGFMTSFFQQRVKHGCGTFDVPNIKVKYRKRFKKFDAVFGRENVILRKFDPAIFPQRCVVADFYQQVGIERQDSRPSLRVNESLTREACGILYAYRKFGPGYGVGSRVMWENRRIIAPLFEMGGCKFKIAKEVLEPGMLRDKEDIIWMEKRLGTSLEEEIRYDGTEVTCEEDLLQITRSSCEEYVALFRKISNVKVPAKRMPTADHVDPEQVAALVQYCRDQVANPFRLISMIWRKAMK